MLLEANPPDMLLLLTIVDLELDTNERELKGRHHRNKSARVVEIVQAEVRALSPSRSVSL